MFMYDDEIVGPKIFILCLLQGMLKMEIAMKRMMNKTMMMIMVQSFQSINALIIDAINALIIDMDEMDS